VVWRQILVDSGPPTGHIISRKTFNKEMGLIVPRFSTRNYLQISFGAALGRSWTDRRGAPRSFQSVSIALSPRVVVVGLSRW
jgi:hypothetical protein